SGLVQNPPSSTPHAPPTKNDWDIMFSLMFEQDAPAANTSSTIQEIQSSVLSEGVEE
ncbi:hypothetical protein Tco_0594431, partial [Tanacetum coccineum]